MVSRIIRVCLFSSFLVASYSASANQASRMNLVNFEGEEVETEPSPATPVPPEVPETEGPMPGSDDNKAPL